VSQEPAPSDQLATISDSWAQLTAEQATGGLDEMSAYNPPEGISREWQTVVAIEGNPND
jgi:hypothetical protein